MKTNSIGKSFAIEKILNIHEMLQKVYHEHLSVVYTMKLS